MKSDGQRHRPARNPAANQRTLRIGQALVASVARVWHSSSYFPPSGTVIQDRRPIGGPVKRPSGPPATKSPDVDGGQIRPRRVVCHTMPAAIGLLCRCQGELHEISRCRKSLDFALFELLTLAGQLSGCRFDAMLGRRHCRSAGASQNDRGTRLFSVPLQGIARLFPRRLCFAAANKKSCQND